MAEHAGIIIFFHQFIYMNHLKWFSTRGLSLNYIFFLN